MAAVAEARRPLIIPAADHQVDLVPPAAGGAGVARRPVVRDPLPAVRREGKAERISKTDRRNRIRRAEWIVTRDGPIGVVAQDLSAEAGRVLRFGRHVVLPQGYVELAVGAEGDPPTLVATVGSGWE